MPSVDTTSHENVFNAEAWGERRTDVVGAGALGSRVALGLGRLGLTSNVHVWDFDNVESHNVANQAYGLADVGKAKVEALRDLVKDQTGLEVTVHSKKVDGSQELGHVVFVLTDTMASRRNIYESLKYKLNTKLIIEARMGTEQGRVYAINPSAPAQIEAYEKTLYDDEVAERSACGTSIAVGPTAEFLSGLAQFQLIRYFAIEQGDREDQLDHESIFCLRPTMFITRRFGDL